MSEFERRMINMRDLRPGDIIHVQGIICEVSEIAWQEPWEWREAYYEDNETVRCV